MLAPVSAATRIAHAGWQQQSVSGDGVQATVAVPGLPPFGFVPVHVTARNNHDRELRWQASFKLSAQTSYGAAVSQWTTTLALPAGRASEHWLFVPTAEPGMPDPGGYYYRSATLQMTVSGRGVGQATVEFNAPGRRNEMVPWAVSASLEQPIMAQLMRGALVSGMPIPGGRTPPRPAITRTRTANLTAFDPAQSLGDWRIWSPFARVVLRADEYASMPPANRAALRQWVALGGYLHLSPSQPQRGGQAPFGAGMIVTLAGPIEHATDDAGGLYTHGVFGSTPVLPRSRDLVVPADGLAGTLGTAEYSRDWLIYFFIAFAMIVGPLNLYAIAPARRRHRLFLTVPGMSLLAVGVLVAAIYLQDGVGGEGARRSLVVLLPGENQAAVFQDQICRTGLLFQGEFPLGADTASASMPAEQSHFRPGRPLAYARQNDTASGDWFRGRARQAQHLRRLVPTRARIELVDEARDGAPIVQSSVGTVLRDFCYTDAAGRVWTAGQVPPGARVTLTSQAGGRTAAQRAGDFGAPASGQFRSLALNAVQAGGSGRFVAVADGSELAPIATLPMIRWKDSAVMVTGAVERAGRKASP